MKCVGRREIILRRHSSNTVAAFNLNIINDLGSPEDCQSGENGLFPGD